MKKLFDELKEDALLEFWLKAVLRAQKKIAWERNYHQHWYSPEAASEYGKKSSESHNDASSQESANDRSSQETGKKYPWDDQSTRRLTDGTFVSVGSGCGGDLNDKTTGSSGQSIRSQ